MLDLCNSFGHLLVHVMLLQIKWDTSSMILVCLFLFCFVFVFIVPFLRSTFNWWFSFFNLCDRRDIGRCKICFIIEYQELVIIKYCRIILGTIWILFVGDKTVTLLQCYSVIIQELTYQEKLCFVLLTNITQ